MNTRLSRLVLPALFVAVFPASVFAQAPLRATRIDVVSPVLQSAAQRPASDGRMILGGLVGGAVGFFLGGYAGALINESEDSDDDLSALAGFALGAVIGETLALPLGVHLGNQRQGNYGLSLLAASAITGVGIAIATSGEDRLEYLIPVPVLQLISSMMIEKRTTN